MLVSVAHGVWRSVGGDQKLDPLLGAAIISGLATVVLIGAYIARSSQSLPPTSVVSPSGVTAGTESLPKIALIPPTDRTELRWDPTKSHMILMGIEGQLVENAWKVPIFRLRTTGQTPASDANIRWQTNVTGLEDLLKSSKKLSAFKFDFVDGQLMISGSSTALPFAYKTANEMSLPVPFITNGGTDVFIPLDVFVNAALYALAVIPETNPDANISPFTFTVTVSWNLPTPRSQKFLVTTKFANAKPSSLSAPVVDALLSFRVDPED